MLRLSSFSVLLAMSVLMVTACSVPYVNIPAQPGDVAANDPDAGNVRKIETQALQAVLADDPQPTPVLIRLPKGTDTLTYAAVASQLGDDVVMPTDDAEPASTLTVEQVRIRGWDAEVDALKPVSGNIRRLVTVYLKHRPMSDWTVKRLRTWRGPVEASDTPTPTPTPGQQGEAQSQ